MRSALELHSNFRFGVLAPVAARGGGRGRANRFPIICMDWRYANEIWPLFSRSAHSDVAGNRVKFNAINSGITGNDSKNEKMLKLEFRKRQTDTRKCVSVCVSVCVCQCVYFWVDPFLEKCEKPRVCHCVCVTLCVRASVCVCVCVWLSVWLSVWLCV